MSDLTYCLLVDDDPDNQEMFLAAAKAVYPSLTCKVENDPVKSPAILKSGGQIPDIIFLNINMPKINGFETLVHLKEDVQLTDIPVIFYSTIAEPSIVKQAMALGASGFVTKQISHKALCGTLKEAFASLLEDNALSNISSKGYKSPSSANE